MAFEVKNDADSVVFRQEFTAQDLEWQDFRSESFTVPTPFGTVKAQQWLFEGIMMSHSELLLNDAMVLDWKGDTELVTMHFNLQGKISIIHRDMPRAFELSSHQHNLFYGKEAEGKMRPDARQMKSFLIQFSPKAFLDIAQGGNDALKRFAEQVEAGKSAALSGTNLNIDANLLGCIHAILHCRYADALKRMFFYSKAIEILVLQAEAFDRASEAKPLYVKTEYDRERILFARDYLLKRMESPPTLAELSRIAGINEFKLKRGFKEIFGQAVFEHLAEARLEIARQDLQEGRKSITEIAFELGYSSPQHFSTAFKKKFGVAPSRFV